MFLSEIEVYMLATFNKDMEYIEGDDLKVTNEVINNQLALFDEEVWTYLEKGVPYFGFDVGAIKRAIYRDLQMNEDVVEVSKVSVNKVEQEIQIAVTVITKYGVVSTWQTQ